MDKTTCEECPAWRICPQKPKREDYADEGKYLIDLESGVWSCKDTVQKVCGENARLKEQIEKMKSDVRRERSYWNSGETQYHLLQGLLDKWEPAGPVPR